MLELKNLLDITVATPNFKSINDIKLIVNWIVQNLRHCTNGIEFMSYFLGSWISNF